MQRVREGFGSKGWGFCFVLVVLFLVACAAPQNRQKSNLTTGTVKTNVQEGVTTQAEIVRLLGSPNLVTKDKEGREVWTYSRQSYDSSAGGFGGGLIVFGGSKAFSSSSASSFDLIITFDEKDVVKNYSIVSSQF